MTGTLELSGQPRRSPRTIAVWGCRRGRCRGSNQDREEQIAVILLECQRHSGQRLAQMLAGGTVVLVPVGSDRIGCCGKRSRRVMRVGMPALAARMGVDRRLLGMDLRTQARSVAVSQAG
jgi:hypothetical protein